MKSTPIILMLTTTLVASQAFAQAAVPNPAEQGRDLYETNCLTCHGPDMINPGTVSYDLRKFPADAKARFVNSVVNGKGQGMPAWRGVVTPPEVDQLWAYVLTRGKL